MELDLISVTPGSCPGTISDDFAGCSTFTQPGCLLRQNSFPTFSHWFDPGSNYRRRSNSARWAELKETIVELYAKDRRNLRLWQVRRIMEIYHNFVATPKQFKDKFREWGVWKYERRTLPTLPRRRRSSSTTAATEISIESTDYAVDEERDPCSLSRNVTPPVKAEQTFSLSRNVTTPVKAEQTFSLSRHATAPVKAEQTFFELLRYLKVRLFNYHGRHFFGALSRWRPDDLIGSNSLTSCHPSQLNSNYSRAMILTRGSCPKPALALFNRTSNVMAALFANHHPALTPSILDAFIEEIYTTNPRTRATMLSQAIEAAEKHLSVGHPIVELCRLLQVPMDNPEEVNHLLLFCDGLFKAFRDELGPAHKVSVYVNLRYFEKLQQVQQFQKALAHLQNILGPVFDHLQPGMESPYICFVRRKANLLRSLNRLDEALLTLRRPIGHIIDWLESTSTGMAGNPMAEETFRFVDAYSHVLFDMRDHIQAIDLHALALELCIAVRGEHDGKTMRMIAGHAAFCNEAGLLSMEASLKLRFEEVFSEDASEFDQFASHRLPCDNCGNGQDTQNFCEAHRQVAVVSPKDRAIVGLVCDRLRDLCGSD